MFSELNVMGDMKTTSYGIIAAKSLLEYTIAKEATKTSTRLEFFRSLGGRETK